MKYSDILQSTNFSIIDKDFFRAILYFKWNLILSKQMPRTYPHLVICQIMDLNP